MSPPIRPYTISTHQAGLSLDADGRFVWPTDRPRRTKLAIQGGGGWRAMQRDGIFDSDEWVVYGLNNFWNVCRDSSGRFRADIWYEFHAIYPYTDGPHAGRQIQDPNDMQWLRECPVPIYTVEPFPENPRAVVWPLERYTRTYRRYIACTFAVQLMTALEEGFDEVAVYGLALLNGTQREATLEASNVAYWLGMLEGRGVRVTIPLAVDDDGRDYKPLLLAHPFVYGLDYWEESDFALAYLSTWHRRPKAV